MSLTLNMVGGGGGGLKATDALLRVQAPAGSTVTITKGTTTKTDMGHENADDHTVYDYYFIIHQSQFDSNPWTVTATLNGQTASDTIIIDAADEYDVPLSYDFILYRMGVEYVPISLSQSGNVTVTKKDTYIEAVVPSGSGGAARIYPTSAISLAQYSTLSCTIDIKSQSGSPTIAISIRTSASASATSSANFTNATGEQTATLDISGQTGSFYPMFTSSSGASTVHFLDMRLIR